MKEGLKYTDSDRRAEYILTSTSKGKNTKYIEFAMCFRYILCLYRTYIFVDMLYVESYYSGVELLGYICLNLEKFWDENVHFTF